MDYIVTCPLGVSYLEHGFDGGDNLKFQTGSKIREFDVLAGRISAGALVRLETVGRVKRIDGHENRSAMILEGQKNKEAKVFDTK